jgi:hypothetical protein
MVIHTPVSGAPRVERGPHVKTSNKFCECQIYLPLEGDDTPGSDIEVFAVRPGFRPPFHGQNEADPAYLQLVSSARYRPGTMFLFLITPRSITQMAIRGTSRFPTRYFSILAELPRRLFDQVQPPELVGPDAVLMEPAPAQPAPGAPDAGLGATRGERSGGWRRLAAQARSALRFGAAPTTGDPDDGGGVPRR